MTDLPKFPADDLKAAAGTAPEAHAAIDALHGELQAGSPNPARIQEHVETLRRVPGLIEPLESWWLDPRTQTFFAELNAAGL